MQEMQQDESGWNGSKRCQSLQWCCWSCFQLVFWVWCCQKSCFWAILAGSQVGWHQITTHENVCVLPNPCTAGLSHRDFLSFGIWWFPFPGSSGHFVHTDTPEWGGHTPWVRNAQENSWQFWVLPGTSNIIQLKFVMNCSLSMGQNTLQKSTWIQPCLLQGEI